ncbi:efflux RND transporter periplasmic adaptor subunit [Magnetococcus sp. PR-3]|uniref:efflux RND transporter periplasmic adaptor subunit n=1 Tax=Magnetococcus sp. PR-3 TaxID=3120355 RepID=UPI002FCDEEC1
MNITKNRHRVMTFLFLLLWVPMLAWAEEGGTKFTCPMHPHYIADEMGTCPICGMDLVPMESGAGVGALQGQDAEERAVVTISPETIQNSGIRFGYPQQTEFGRRIRAFGMVMENDRAQTVVSSRISGWIEKLHVTAVGDDIRKGAVLYKLFSPELVAAQRDYINAITRGGNGRMKSAAQRLYSLGVAKRFIRQLEKSKKVVEKVPFYAESSGTLSKLEVRQGSYVKPGMLIAKVQNYDSVWINASVAEKDLGFITKQTPVRIMLPNLPGREINSQIDYIHPTIDAASRTGIIRLKLDNREGELRPGAYADVVFEVGAIRRLALPNGALLRDPEGFHVVVSLGEGRFQPQAVKTGLSSGGYTEILEGLDAEDEIVLSGQFLIDSESALRESFQKLQRLKTPLHALSLDKGQMAMVDHLVDAALYMHEAMADGYDLDSKQLQPARDIRDLLWKRFGQTKLGKILDESASAIGRAQKARTDEDLHQALSDLTKALQPWILKGQSRYYQEKGVHLFMESDTHERRWIQLGSDAFNPFGDAPSHQIPFPKLKAKDGDAKQQQPVVTGGTHVH